jgi:hypothetical protein
VGEWVWGWRGFLIRLSDALLRVKRNSDKWPGTSPCAKKSWRLQITGVADPAIFVIDLQDGNEKIFFLNFCLLLLSSKKM